jgi:hypothetical protein
VVIQHSTIGRKDEAGAQGSVVRTDGTTWTLDGRGDPDVIVYENHAQDSRITESENVSPTLHSKMGTGGNNVPLVEAFDVRNLEDTGDVTQTVQSKKSGGYSLNYMPVVFQSDGSGMEVTEDGTTPIVLHGGDGPQAHGAYRKLAVAMEEGGGNGNADTQEVNTNTILSILRKEIGEEAFTQWGLGILDTLQQATVLQSALHGSSVRSTSQGGRGKLSSALSSKTTGESWPMREMWLTECKRCASQEWGLVGSILEQFRTYLSQLSQPGTSQAQALYDMWKASEGLGILRQALSAFQEIWESLHVSTQSAQPVDRSKGLKLTIRRFTPLETELLQGFPPGWTAVLGTKQHTIVQDDYLYIKRQLERVYGRKFSPEEVKRVVTDSHRYCQMGNAVAVPVVLWIAKRLVAVWKSEPVPLLKPEDILPYLAEGGQLSLF